MICMGAGTNHWFHSDQTYRTFLALLLLCGCEGRNGGGWAHYVGPGEGPPAGGLADARVRARLDAAAAPPVGHAVLLPRHRAVALRAHPARGPRLAARAGAARGPPHRRRQRARRAAGLAAVVPELRPQPARPGRRGRAGRRRRPPTHVVAELREGRLRFACEDPDAPAEPPAGVDRLALEPARLLGQGPRVLPQAPARRRPDTTVRAEESPPELRPREVRWREEAPEGKLDLLTTIDFRMTTNALYSDVVLPAATWYEKYDLSTTDMHPFVHAFNQAVPPPWEAKTDWDAFGRIAERVLAAGRAPPRRPPRPGRGPAAARHARRDRPAAGRGARLARRRVRAGAGPHDAEADRRRARLPARRRAVGARSGRWWSSSARSTRARRWIADEEIAELRRAERRGARRRGRRAPVAGARRAGVRGDPRAVGHHQRPARRARASARWSDAPASTLADLAEPRAGDRITFQDAQVQPRTVITSPEWSGIEAHGRRYAPFTINVERDKPWHTLSGRLHFYLDHAWMLELGEGLPAFRPPLHHRRRSSATRAPATARADGADAALPDAALEVVDPLRVPGQPAHADAVPRRRDAVDEPRGRRGARASATTTGSRPYNRNGVVACRASVSHRIPEGTCLMYHAKDRHLNVPLTELDGQARRHRQLADPDRDEADALHRRLRAALVRLQLLRARPARSATRSRSCASARRRSSSDEDPRAGRDGHEPRQVHRLPHLLGHLQAGLDQPARRRVHVVQRRRDQARPRLPEALGGPGAVAAAAGSSTARAGCG